MKKLIAMIIGLMMAFSLVACGDPSGNTGGGGGGNNPIVIPEDYDPDDPEQYIYRSVFANSPYKDQWDTSENGAELDGIWDSSVLPNCFPDKPSSVTEEYSTEFVGKLDEKGYYSSSPGKLDTDGEDDYTYYLVMFQGTQDTLDAIIADLSENMAIHDERDPERIRGSLHAYSTDWYVYCSYYDGGEYDRDTYEWISDGIVEFHLYATPAYYQVPRVVCGINLPQTGYLMYKVDSLWHISGEDYDETDEIEYNYQTGVASGPIKEYWSTFEISYYGADQTVFDAWFEYLEDEGFEIASEDTSSSLWYKYFTNDDVTVRISYDAEYASHSLEIYKGQWY